VRPEFEPLLYPVEIASLRPSQMAVGMREVARKRAEWHEIAEREGRDFLGRHMIPAVRGPKRRFHLIDNHHLARALQEEKVEHGLGSVPKRSRKRPRAGPRTIGQLPAGLVRCGSPCRERLSRIRTEPDPCPK
jgi:hypothetical protein